MGGGGQTPHRILPAGRQFRIAGDALRLGLLAVDQSVGGPDGAFVEPRQIVGRIEKIGLVLRQGRLVAVDEGPPHDVPAKITPPPGLGDGVGRRDLAGAFQRRDLGIELTELGAEFVRLFASPVRSGSLSSANSPSNLATVLSSGTFAWINSSKAAVPQRQPRDLSGDSLLQRPQSGLAFGQALLDGAARFGLRDGGMENRRISRRPDGFELQFQLAGLRPAPAKLLRRRIGAGAQLALFGDQRADIGQDGPGRDRLHRALDRQVGAEPAQQVERLFTKLAKLAVPLRQVGTLIADGAALLVQGLDIGATRENRGRHRQPGQFRFQAPGRLPCSARYRAAPRHAGASRSSRRSDASSASATASASPASD